MVYTFSDIMRNRQYTCQASFSEIQTSDNVLAMHAPGCYRAKSVSDISLSVNAQNEPEALQDVQATNIDPFLSTLEYLNYDTSYQ